MVVVVAHVVVVVAAATSQVLLLKAQHCGLISGHWKRLQHLRRAR